ncbi:DNA-nicking Smr family endonuclease [Litorimonas taeanensis]|uniref:DNA-nicking Smr family endonuclease n=1 Tax=Litorimonas taeanensis TaxID=568099 RepID=A0A420WEN3_9PROT|nr:Smr/MutS family protein [Litorimonas taeanensis]RKQ69422.1 DNA-nicking Smr family endonuclease [Litorimonas taeanensis]
MSWDKEKALKPQDKADWKRVARTVAPRRYFKGKGSAKPLPTREDFANMLRIGPVESATAKAIPKTLEVNNDKKTRRGRVEIDAKIDLHDMTQAEAQPALVKAVMRAAKHNKKCLLVVTGKGQRLDGVLRRNFPNWINDPSLRPLIATYAQAHIKHGGSGAWYVFLKR